MQLQRKTHVLVLVLALFFVCLPCFGQWQVAYEANTLPDVANPAWRAFPIGPLAEASVSEGILRINDTVPERRPAYMREIQAIPFGTPITLEARLRVASEGGATADAYPVVLAVSTNGYGLGRAFVSISPTALATKYGYDAEWQVVPFDARAFHVYRIALAGNGTFSIWADGALVFAGAATTAHQTGIHFGANLSEDLVSDSYWDYVRYSNEYLPVPEPSGLLALAGGMSGLLALQRRRAQVCASPGRRLQ